MGCAVWYRFYELNEDDHVLTAANLEFVDDAEALAAAEARAGRYGLEIWQASRRVGAVGPQPQPAPSAQSLVT